MVRQLLTAEQRFLCELLDLFKGKDGTKNEFFREGLFQKMRPNPRFPADLVPFTEVILNGKLHFLCSESLPSYDPGRQQKEV